MAAADRIRIPKKLLRQIMAERRFVVMHSSGGYGIVVEGGDGYRDGRAVLRAPIGARPKS